MTDPQFSDLATLLRLQASPSREAAGLVRSAGLAVIA